MSSKYDEQYPVYPEQEGEADRPRNPYPPVIKQYRITSADFVGSIDETTGIPDAVLSPEDQAYIKQFQNHVAKR